MMEDFLNFWTFEFLFPDLENWTTDIQQLKIIPQYISVNKYIGSN